MVIENTAPGAVDPEADCPPWVSAWLPGPLLAVGTALQSVASSAVGALVGTHEDAGEAYPAVAGERVELEVTFVADSATAHEIVAVWLVGTCGELLEASHCRFDNVQAGDRLTTTQTVRSNGCGGEVVCTVTDVCLSTSLCLFYRRRIAVYRCSVLVHAR